MDAPKITPQEVKAALDAGEKITFVDNRSPKEWDASDARLPGAIRIAAAEMAEHLHEIPAGRVVTYCT